MKRLKFVLGQIAAWLALPVILATFIGMDFWARSFAQGTGIKISPWYSGGDVRTTVKHETYETLIRRPVFDGLISERPEGFVQVEWKAAEGGSLPPLIVDPIDADGDGRPDFTVHLDTQKNVTTLSDAAPEVIEVERTYVLGEGERAIRVRLRNKQA